ncbi:MAG: hypothetical protein IPJ30_01695 [Acidobacteria bacterium]|nr:hypothetical protein [Acidobacteriota bacterium]
MFKRIVVLALAGLCLAAVVFLVRNHIVLPGSSGDVSASTSDDPEAVLREFWNAAVAGDAEKVIALGGRTPRDFHSRCTGESSAPAVDSGPDDRFKLQRLERFQYRGTEQRPVLRFADQPKRIRAGHLGFAARKKFEDVSIVRQRVHNDEALIALRFVENGNLQYVALQRSAGHWKIVAALIDSIQPVWWERTQFATPREPC